MHRMIKEWLGFAVIAVLIFAFRSSVADWNDVPTGSMKPTIIEGDRILVDKMAYDLRVPFTHIALHQFADPQRGDIVVFDSAVADKQLVKRVIGLPGDMVELQQNHLFINGKPAVYDELNNEAGLIQLHESFAETAHRIQVSDINTIRSSFSRLVVPAEHYLVLGDNRDNSADSRYIGFVPRKEISGRSKYVVLSLDYDNYFLPRRQRFMHALDQE